MSSALSRFCQTAVVGFALATPPAVAGIDLVTAPAPPEDQIDLELEEYVPFSGTPTGITD